MTYTTVNIEGVEVEEYVTGRILRVKAGAIVFKLFVQSEGENTVAIYLGHGELTFPIKSALLTWAKSRGIKTIHWGRHKSFNSDLNIV